MLPRFGVGGNYPALVARFDRMPVNFDEVTMMVEGQSVLGAIFPAMLAELAMVEIPCLLIEWLRTMFAKPLRAFPDELPDCLIQVPPAS